MKKISLFLSFSLLIILVVTAFIAPTETGGGLAVGDIAPDFKLKSVEGSYIGLSDYKDVKGFIVVFTCNTCPYAVLYEDRIIDLHHKYAAKGYPVVAINPNDPTIQPGDSYEAMKKRAAEKNFPFAYLFDAYQEVFPQYGATRTPYTFVLDKNRKVQYIGSLDNSPQYPNEASERYVESAIDALEAGQTPQITFTKAIGCGIKSYKKF